MESESLVLVKSNEKHFGNSRLGGREQSWQVYWSENRCPASHPWPVDKLWLQKKASLWSLRPTLVLTNPRRARAWKCRAFLQHCIRSFRICLAPSLPGCGPVLPPDTHGCYRECANKATLGLCYLSLYVPGLGRGSFLLNQPIFFLIPRRFVLPLLPSNPSPGFSQAWLSSLCLHFGFYSTCLHRGISPSLVLLPTFLPTQRGGRVLIPLAMCLSPTVSGSCSFLDNQALAA